MIEAEGFAGLDPSARQIRALERQGRLNRAVEFLPDEDALADRAAQRQGLSRPEIAVLFSCCKIALNEEILASDLPDDPYLAEDVVQYFPTALRDRFRADIARHRLRRELIATSITNSLINRMGATFVSDIGEKTGLPGADVARAYVVARDVFAVRTLWKGIEAPGWRRAGSDTDRPSSGGEAADRARCDVVSPQRRWSARAGKVRRPIRPADRCSQRRG